MKKGNIMKKKMSNFAFKMMTYIGMPIRNIFMNPDKILAEIKIKPGSHILDFGCGPGVFTIKLAEKTGRSGLIYALDIHPLASKTIRQKARRKNLENIRTIQSDCSTSLPDNSLDCVIFFDVFHVLNNQEEVLMELYRVLKPEAIMYFSDHHLVEARIVTSLTENGLFKLMNKGERTYSFGKIL